MNSTDDGGPAFPQNSEDEPAGMTLRDWFAGQALAGLVSAGLTYGTQSVPCDPWPRVAEQAYAAADAMLRARK